MELRHAERRQAKIKMGLQAPGGAGKTYSALILAYGLINDWSHIAVIDTENHSADLYAHLGNYQVLALEQSFSPERYIQAIEVCERAGMEAIIIDSISHEWESTGGILDIHGAMMGNSFTNGQRSLPVIMALCRRSCIAIAILLLPSDLNRIMCCQRRIYILQMVIRLNCLTDLLLRTSAKYSLVQTKNCRK